MTDEPMNDAPTKEKNEPRKIWWYIATWFGAGLLPISGTMGSLAALPFAYIIQISFGEYGNFALFAASLIIFFVGWWVAEKYVRTYGGDDPGEIVVDEVAGQWLLLSVLFPTFHSYLVGFLLFRLFDIIKPWPVSWADQKIKGGLGVMADDMLAALYPILFFLALMLETQIFHGQKLILPLIRFLGGRYVQ